MKLRHIDETHKGFMCPECDEEHVVRVGCETAWGWNGSADVPTFTPSILVQSGHFSPYWAGMYCWCT